MRLLKMKRLLLLFLLGIMIQTTGMAQRGVQLFAQFGLSDVGNDIWYQTKGDLTGGIMVPISSFWSLGGYYTFSLDAKFSVFASEERELSASMNEYGLISRYTVYRTGKFNFYLQNTLSNITVDNTDNLQGDIDIVVADGQSFDPPPVIGKESTFAIGGGLGINFRASPRVTINIFQFNFKLIEDGFMGIDRTGHRDYKIGVIYQFQKGK